MRRESSQLAKLNKRQPTCSAQFVLSVPAEAFRFRGTRLAVIRKMLDEGLGRDAWFGAFVVALADRLARADAPPAQVSQPGSASVRSAV
jgi:hypothetical protein